MQPILITARFKLRPAQQPDVNALWALWTDPQVRRYVWDDQVIARETAADTLADCIALGSEGLGLWLVMLAQTPVGSPHPCDPLLGCAGLLPASLAAEHDSRLSGLVEPLIALRPAHWGRGYAHEALCALLRYAVTTLGLTRLAGVADVPNVASDRMLRRAGFAVLGQAPGRRNPLRTFLWDAMPAPSPGQAPDAQ